MADAKEVNFTLKVRINKQNTKVLFAEIDSNFADVLLSFLTLPLGTIVRILEKHYGADAPAIGSLTTLYNGISNLESHHFSTELAKLLLLNPINSFLAEHLKLKLDISDDRSIKFFSCEDWECSVVRRQTYISLYRSTAKCECGKMMNREVSLKEPKAADGDRGVFTSNTASFLISDDLNIVPNLAVSVMQTLKNLGITDMDVGELRIVTFGFNEIMDLLKASLMSRTPLSDLIIGKGKVKLATKETEPRILFHEKDRESASSISKKMVLNVMVQKSTNKFLFAQSEDDFVDLLCTMLIIPLGGVECLLGGNTCVKSIDNLFMSIRDLIDDKYFATPDMKKRLMKPDLPYGYSPERSVLPLREQVFLYYLRERSQCKEWLSFSAQYGYHYATWHPKCEGNYVKRPKMCMVADDLTVTPLCMNSSLSLLNELKIPLSDVREVEIQIGLEEALSILKASLISTSALTDGLMISSVSKEQSQRKQKVESL